MPYAPEYSPDASPSLAARANAAARRRIRPLWVKQWDVNTGMTQDMLAAIRSLLDSGHPVAIGMRWPRQVKIDGDHVLQVPEPADVFDGHSVVLVGYRDDEQHAGGGLFTFRDSSGPDWQDEGHACLPYAYVEAYGNDALAIEVGEGEPIRTNCPIPERLEAEELPVVSSTRCPTSTQSMKPFGEMVWSKGTQLFAAAEAGSRLELRLAVHPAAEGETCLYATRAPDFGIISLRLDGVPLGPAIDLYGEGVEPTGRIALGRVSLREGDHLLQVEVIGRSEASRACRFGLDCIELWRE